MEDDIIQEIIYISKRVLTCFAILIYLVVLITYIFRKTQNGLLDFYNMLLIFFGIIHSCSILIPKQERKSALCTIQSLMNMEYAIEYVYAAISYVDYHFCILSIEKTFSGQSVLYY